MKKTKFLALALAVAVMVVGAGYAYWSETLTIGNSVTTGELDVVFSNPTEGTGSEYITESDVNVEEDHVLSVEYSDVYPGATGNIKFDLENKGTLKAYVNEFAIVNQESNNDADPDDFINDILVTDLKIDDLTISEDIITLEEALDEINALNDNNGIDIDDDSSKTIELSIKIDDNAEEDTVAEGTTYTFDITADVDQYNEVE